MRYFIEIAYNGKNYNGWQAQPNEPTVQETLTHAVSTILAEEIKLVGAGRTDTGVHALQLFAHFDIGKQLDLDWLVKRLNAFLPEDIVVKSVFLVGDEHHARFDALSRSYEYRILLGRDPFLTDTTWQIHHREPDLDAMNKAAALLPVYTDFKCFSKSNTDVKTYNCKIVKAQWILNGNRLTFYITADRFLRNMVRAIVGTLIDVGLHKTSIEDFMRIIESRNRSEAGLSVPPQGLFLSSIVYPEEIIKNYHE